VLGHIVPTVFDTGLFLSQQYWLC